MSTFEQSHLASSIIWWLNYISSVGREYIISEGSLKIPATEYIERFYRDNIQLEFNHPSLQQKRFDLVFSSNNPSIACAFEFKFVREDSTRAISERKRIFNDLMRLHLFLGPNKKGFFLICGNQLHFNTSFLNLRLTPKIPITRTKKKNTNKPNKLSGFFSEWFSFDIAQPNCTIDIAKPKDAYKNIYDSFQKEYSEAFLNATGTNLVMPNTLTTKLIFLSEELYGSNIPQTFRIGVWEII